VSTLLAIGGGGAPTPPQMITLAQRLVPTAGPNQVWAVLAATPPHQVSLMCLVVALVNSALGGWGRCAAGRSIGEYRTLRKERVSYRAKKEPECAREGADSAGVWGERHNVL
jgi:hypothetical protein